MRASNLIKKWIIINSDLINNKTNYNKIYNNNKTYNNKTKTIIINNNNNSSNNNCNNNKFRLIFKVNPNSKISKITTLNNKI